MVKLRGANVGASVIAQHIYETSTTQKHRLGTRVVMGDRVFRYTKAGAAITQTTKGAINYHKPYQGNRAATAYPVGTTEIIIPTTASSNSVSNTAVDAYAEGYLSFQTDPGQMHKIRSNTVSDGSNQVHTLYDELTTELPTGTAGTTRWVTIWPSIYSDVREGNTATVGFFSVVCVPLIQVAASSFFWGQTWGPCFLTAFSTAPGKTIKYREVYFQHTDMSVINGGGATDNGLQRAGYLLAQTTSSDGDQFIMLQLSP